MMNWPVDGVPLCDVLEPVLNVAAGDEQALRAAVVDVAEVLAALGVLIVDARGAPVFGVSDERAVLGALGTYGRGLATEGRIGDALDITDLMDRVDRLNPEPPRPRSRRRAR